MTTPFCCHFPEAIAAYRIFPIGTVDVYIAVLLVTSFWELSSCKYHVN